MQSFRRQLLDRCLEDAALSMRGRVLDIGGVRTRKKGRFRPPLERVDSWQYLNLDSAAEPDYLCSAEDIPLADGSVDTVVMTEVLQYLERPEAVVQQVHRVLAADGVCLASSPFMFAAHGDDHVDRRRFSAVGLRELFGGAGFASVDVQAMGSVGSTTHDLLHVALGYAHPKESSLTRRALRRLVRRCEPLFRRIDRLTEAQSRYVTTGHFIVARKSES